MLWARPLAVAMFLAALTTGASAQVDPFRYSDGKAWEDPRGLATILGIAGTAVTGTFKVTEICDPGANMFLAGGSGALILDLRGPWEGRAGFIFGGWTGDIQFCGSGGPGAGNICMFLGRNPSGELGMLTRIFGAPAGTGYDYHSRVLSRPGQAIGLTPLAAASVPVRFDYPNGRALADGRPFQMALNVQGDRVFGTMRIEPVCTSTTFLPGGDLEFEGTLDGAWEAPATTLTGFWGGDGIYCNGETRPDFGTFSMAVAANDVEVDLAGVRGESYTYLAPLAGMTTAGPAAPDPFFATAILACDMPVPTLVAAPPPPPPPPPPPGPGQGGGGGGVSSSIVLLLDASGSMGDMGRMDRAKAAARRVLGQMDGTVEVALIVFYDCGMIEVAAPFTSDPAVISAALEPVQPTGSTPLAAGIAMAKDYLRANGRGSTFRLVVLTDGEETCDGNLLESVRG